MSKFSLIIDEDLSTPYSCSMLWPFLIHKHCEDSIVSNLLTICRLLLVTLISEDEASFEVEDEDEVESTGVESRLCRDNNLTVNLKSIWPRPQGDWTLTLMCIWLINIKTSNRPIFF